MRKFILGLTMAVILAAVPAFAWDLSGDFLSTGSGEVVDLSDFYAKGPADNVQVVLWTNSTTDLSSVHNATLYGSPFGVSGYETIKVSFPDGTTAATAIADIDNALDPSVVGFSGWAFDQIKIVNQSPSATAYTINYVITGW